MDWYWAASYITDIATIVAISTSYHFRTLVDSRINSNIVAAAFFISAADIIGTILSEYYLDYLYKLLEIFFPVLILLGQMKSRRFKIITLLISLVVFLNHTNIGIRLTFSNMVNFVNLITISFNLIMNNKILNTGSLIDISILFVLNAEVISNFYWSGLLNTSIPWHYISICLTIPYMLFQWLIIYQIFKVKNAS
jgi:hypothetical protein